MYTEKSVVKCESGLHNRQATFFIQKANEFRSSIWIEVDDRKINAKSLLGVLSMAITTGTEVTLIAEGPDEEAAVKTLAQKNGLHATFMPKPIFGINGSGMHTNMSLFKDGKNVFFDETGDKMLSADAYHFIAGLLHHIGGMTAILNPLVNSYKRLVPG